MFLARTVEDKGGFTYFLHGSKEAYVNQSGKVSGRSNEEQYARRFELSRSISDISRG